MKEQLELLPAYLGGHVALALLALLIGTLLSVPLGIVATRFAWLERVVLAVAGVIQTIPGLALLAAMVPLLAALHLRSIGFLPALLGLSLYGLLPILRNTVTGIAGVDPALKEAAQGVGMTPGEQLRLVELPLALPVIVAGVRTATVWIVGMATLSTPVGAPSLGNFIFSGLQTRNTAAVLLGCVASAALALLLDLLVRTLERAAAERRRGLGLGAGLVLLGLYGWVGVSLGASGAARAPVVTIGTKTFTEQYVLAEILAQRVHTETGLEARTLPSLGSTVAFDALAAGDIDVYVDYSGTIWATLMHRTDVADRDTVLREVGAWLKREHRITLSCSLGFENAYALAMRSADAQKLHVRTISELVPHAPQLTIGADYEFLGRAEWKALRARYGLGFAAERSMDPSLMYQAAAQGNVDVISAFSTDGRIDAMKLVVLKDDRQAIPPYDAIVLAGERLAREHPEVLRALEGLSGKIDAARMRAMNRAVDEEHRSVKAVAEAFSRR